jgi:flavodoxin
MKTLIACYSLTGNTLTVAEALKAELNADFTRIEAEKEPGYLMKCFNALRKKKAMIKQCTTDMKDYDLIVVCSPVWASGAPPAVNEYISELKGCDGKKYGAIVTFGGSGASSVEDQIKRAMLPKKIAFVGSLLVKAGNIAQGAYKKDLKDFAAALNK